MRPWVDQTNKAHREEIREVSMECAEEKSAVDRSDPVYSSLLFVFLVHSLRHTEVTVAVEM